MSPRACARSATRSIRTLGLRDIARLDFRITPEGRIYLLEVNALPALATLSSSLFAATAQVGLTYNATIAAILNAAALRRVSPPRRSSASRARARSSRSASASPTTSSAPRPATTKPSGSAGDDHRDRERARAPGPHRRPPRGHGGPAARARGSRCRPDLQHRGRRRRPEPRGPGPRAVRAARHPVHRLRLGHARDRARQGARQEGAAPARHPHAEVPGHGDRRASGCRRT